MTKAEIENRIARVNAAMAMEGMPLGEDMKKLLEEVLKGNLTFEEARKTVDEVFPVRESD